LDSVPGPRISADPDLDGDEVLGEPVEIVAADDVSLDDTDPDVVDPDSDILPVGVIDE
jgi:hypothetical protein